MDIDEQENTLDEEAVAEEEFIADPEETIKDNPLVYDNKNKENNDSAATNQKQEALVGAIGTGDLTFGGGPFNNEEALRSESVNSDDNAFGANPSSENPFGGPETAPLSDATETIAPAATTASQGETEVSGAVNFSTETNGMEVGTAMANSESASTTNFAQGTGEAAPVSADSSAAAPVVTAAPATAEQAAKPKKKKTGLIIGIIVIVLLLGLGIGGIVFYVLHESKERVLSDAMTSTLSADARQFDGSVTLTAKDKKKAGFENVKLNFKSDSKGANFSGSGNLEIKVSDDMSFSVDVAGAYISKDGIFVKLDKLAEAIDGADLEAMFGGSASGDEESKMISDLLKDTLKGAVKAIDGKWYKIDGDTFKSNNKVKEEYDCITSALDEASSKEVKDKILDIYKEHSFVEADDKKDTESADGLTYYYVKSNSDEYKAFSKEVSKLEVTKKLESCMDSGSVEKDDDDDEEDEDEEKSEGEFDLKFGIKGWSHELRSVKGTATTDGEDGYSMNLDVKLDYEDKNVSAPTCDAENVINAVDDIKDSAIKSFKESYPKFAKKMCEKEFGTDPQMVKMCEQEANKQMDEMLEQLVGGFSKELNLTSLSSLGE